MRNQKPLSREREFVAAKRRHRGWTKVMGVLACVVVFCTTYALILPAITLESDTHCGLVEHQHTEECYTEQLICGLEEQAEESAQEPAQGHTHTEECYGEVETLVCGLPESEGHTHGESCYDAGGNLTCGLEESEGHTHTAGCCAVESVLTCGQQEGQPEPAQPHVHTEACYGPVLTCELEEHTHTDACYIDASADVETAADWEATLPAELTGVWADDLLAVAESQIGYAESALNYTLTEDGSHKGYTRYGAWYGMPYEDWCAMFASFCLNYAGIPAESMPRASACQSWINTLSSEEWNLYVAVERQEGSSDLTEDSYLPVPGDLVFFDFNRDGASDHVGIVAEYTEATLLKGAQLKTIEGNSGGKVQYVTYDPADPDIMGYAMLPENLTTLTYAGEDYTVTVTYGPDAELPEAVELSAAEYARDDETYLARYAEAAQLYGWGADEDMTEVFRLFSIGFFVEGGEIEPAAPVRVTVTYPGQEMAQSYQVTHFGSQETETVDAASACEEGTQTVDFTLNSFSDVGIMPLVAGNVVEGVSPVGTTINLFDYSVSGDVSTEVGQPNNNTAGINAQSNFKFNVSGSSIDGLANLWTGSAANSNNGIGGVRQGIVDSTLGADGYPVLSGTLTNDDRTSLDYLFDPTESVSSNGVNYKATHTNVGGLLQEDKDGYYYYDSTENYAEYDKTSNSFTLYDSWAVYYGTTTTGSGPNVSTTKNQAGQFFPFNAYSTVGQDTTADNGSLNHYFGMTLTTKFVQQYGGHTDSTRDTATTFEFSGDDDVWIFIDGVLVADLGGIHDAASVDIDFAAGTVTIDKVWASTNGGYTANKQAKTFTDIFKGTEVSLEEGTLVDDTYHTLKFFYLERGGNSSNLKLKYNLNEYPATSIYKVNQYGGTVQNAGFAVYAADENYNYIEKAGATSVNSTYDIVDGGKTYKCLYYGTTDAKGEMIFLDADGLPATLDDIEDMFGTHFILKEVSVPEGYRLVSDEIHLTVENGLLACDNQYSSGVYSSTNILAKAPDIVQSVLGTNGQTQTYALDPKSLDQNVSDIGGKLYAVVMKYVGPGLTAENCDSNLANGNYWAPVHGSDMGGYTVVDDWMKDSDPNTDIWSAISETIQKTNNVFDVSSSGAWQCTIENLPGDITTYYNYIQNLGDQVFTKTQYALAYYYVDSTVTELSQIDSSNTHRIDADADGAYAFDRSYGATVEVPNLVNRLFAQKLDESGDLVNGATFALYNVEEVTSDTTSGNATTIYYIADGTVTDESDTRARIYLYDDAGDNTGKAVVKGGTTEGTYSIDAETGKITVNAGSDTYTITPVQVEKTLDADDKDNNPSREDGTATFDNLNEGTYYLREVAAPAGYALNPAEVMVLVTDVAIYANAGTEEDGVSVGRGPGYVVSTLNQFASEGEIDNTLTWIYEKLRVSGVSTTFRAYDDYATWDYLASYTGNGFDAVTETATGDESGMRINLEYDSEGSGGALFNYVRRSEKSDDPDASKEIRLYTSVGWGYYEIYQDYEYGSVQAKANGAAYENLGNQEIANLFSRSTYIQVADHQLSDLEISKTVAGTTGSTQEFTFTVKVPNAEGTYTCTVYNVDEKGNRTEVENGTLSITSINSGADIHLKDGQVAVIKDLPGGASYTVTETGVSGYSASYSIEGGSATTGSTAAGTLVWSEGETGDRVTTVAFTNTYVEPLDLTLRKYATGTDTPLSGAQFVLYYTENSTDYYYTESDANVTWTATGTTMGTDAAGQIQFNDLPDGEYHLKETVAPAGYLLPEKEITFTVSGGKITAGPNGNYTDTTLTVYNSTGIALPNTGGSGTWLYTTAGLLLMCGAGWLLYKSKLRGKEDERGTP